MPPTPRRSLPLTFRVIFVALTILLVPGLFQGCSGCTCEECFAHGVAAETRRDAARDYVYSAPLSVTEQALAGYLKDTGYDALPSPLVRGNTVTVGAASAPGTTLRIEVKPALVGDRYRLELTAIHEETLDDGGKERGGGRVLDAEWAIAAKVDPAFAAKTEARAEERTERAKSVGRGCDRGCELGCRACETCARHAAPPPR